TAVALAHCVGLAAQIERSSRLRPGDEVKGTFAESLQRLLGYTPIDGALKGSQKSLALTQPFVSGLRGRIESRYSKAGRRGVVQVVADTQRRGSGAQEAATEVARLHISVKILQPDVGRDIVSGGKEPGRHRSEIGSILRGGRMAGHAD